MSPSHTHLQHTQLRKANVTVIEAQVCGSFGATQYVSVSIHIYTYIYTQKFKYNLCKPEVTDVSAKAEERLNIKSKLNHIVNCSLIS